MDQQRLAAACCIVAGALGASAAQAQDVHKCTVNGQVTYQAKPCASADVVVPITPGPSDQEQRDARGDLFRQHFQAATGHLMPPPPRAIVATPPPPPPAPMTLIQSPPQTTSTTMTIISSPSRSTTVIRTTRTTTSVAAAPPPANNCEKLNRDNGEALDRREQLKTPSDLSSHAEVLQNVQAQLDRIHDMAHASNCRLTR